MSFCHLNSSKNDNKRHYVIKNDRKVGWYRIRLYPFKLKFKIITIWESLSTTKTILDLQLLEIL